MASHFQEISLSPSPQISLPSISPESFLLNLEDANNQIDFLFALNTNQQQARRDDSISADDDGFRTPTSSDHKIPVIKQCPPAPRRPKPISCRSRRSSPRLASGVRRGFRVYISDEIVESIFSSSFAHQKMKKARRDDHEDE
ncbi:cyclin-dependent protein kinase inhibitor SMR2-like [Momordica charantia]|uniref:Cyclin-dependent protein kinase inhibitor SMR2-like n=1 Tax=Momordica charantia TaxID=3673 RepID=A0A6J1CQ22_MOMCH|nr:cyclin-dependent protein kinase inhibitor SMR2-like [Momordica charantia]